MIIMDLVRKGLAKSGYLLLKESVMPKGFYLETDIKRLFFLNKITKVVDIGAFHGDMTNFFLKTFPACHVLAVEPTPDSFKYTSNRFLNNPKVTVLNLGAGDKNDFLAFRINADAQCNSFSTSFSNHSEPAIQVKVKKLDTIIEEDSEFNGAIDFLKLDVEGYELECLKGAEKLLKAEKIGLIYAEVGLINDGHTSFTAIKDTLETYGFSFYSLYELYHYNKPTELAFANALFINQAYIKAAGLML